MEPNDAVNTTSYTRGLGGQLISRSGGGDPSRYYHHDAIGSVVALTNSSSSLTDTYDFTAFGTVWDRTGTNKQPYQYVGNAYDSGFSLYDFHARAYDQATGRFTSKDPIKGLTTMPQTLNPYAYGQNNPFLYPDPSGLWSVSISAYYGRGGGVTFGKDPTTDKFFVIGKGGIGLGGGASFNPLGAFPGPGEDCSCGSASEVDSGGLVDSYANGGVLLLAACAGLKALEGGGAYRCDSADNLLNLHPYRVSDTSPYISFTKPDTTDPRRGWRARAVVEGGVVDRCADTLETMSTNSIVSLIWFVALILLFLLISSNVLPVGFVVVLAFLVLAWLGFFLGPTMWRWVKDPTENALFRYMRLVIVVLFAAGFLLLLYGLIQFAFGPYLATAVWYLDRLIGAIVAALGAFILLTK